MPIRADTSADTTELTSSGLLVALNHVAERYDRTAAPQPVG